MKILVPEALKLVPVSKPTLYKHIKEGKITSERNPQGRIVVDLSELKRFYGIDTPVNGNGIPENLSDTGKDAVIALLKEQLADASEREKKLLSLLEKRWG